MTETSTTSSFEARAERWQDRARAAENTGRRAEQKAARILAGVYLERDVADALADQARMRMAVDPEPFAIESLMKARAKMVVTNAAIALIEHMEDCSTPGEILDDLQEQTITLLLQRSTSGSQSTSMIHTAQRDFEVAATVEFARQIGVS